MKLKLLILLFFFFKGIIPLISCNNPDLTPEYPEDLDKVLKNAVFGHGYIYRNADSVPAEILVYKWKQKSRAYQYCIVKQPDDSIRVCSPKEIDGYSINNEKYIKHISDGQSFFIQLVRSGRITLYRRGGIPFDIRFLYYLKVPGEKDLLVICPHENDVSLTDSKDSRDSPMMIYKSSDAGEKFKTFVSIYLKDCKQILDKVNSGFYTINDIPAVVGEYNDWF